ncbi:unnamed protein product, partial [Mesorhabditis belari]|uniref:RING-type domain-containing protein n=1 Tax=Mesorhabditis belari TaxID=2138241 RepID=A0AAF3EA51_9BILA
MLSEIVRRVRTITGHRNESSTSSTNDSASSPCPTQSLHSEPSSSGVSSGDDDHQKMSADQQKRFCAKLIRMQQKWSNREQNEKEIAELLSPEDRCTICHYRFAAVKFLPCGHRFACKSCIAALLQENLVERWANRLKCQQCNEFVRRFHLLDRPTDDPSKIASTSSKSRLRVGSMSWSSSASGGSTLSTTSSTTYASQPSIASTVSQDLSKNNPFFDPFSI